MKKVLALTTGCLIAVAAVQADPIENRTIAAERKGFFTFTTRAGFVAPIGNYGNIANSGIGLQAAAEYYLTNRWAVGLSVGYAPSNSSEQAKRDREAVLSSQAAVEGLYRLRPDETDRNLNRIPGAPVTISSWRIRTVQFGAFARHIISTGLPKVNPYLAAGVGIYNTGGRISGTGATQSQLEQATGTQNKTSLGANVGTGLMYSFTPAIGLSLGAAYHNAFSNPATNYLMINGGLNFLTNLGP